MGSAVSEKTKIRVPLLDLKRQFHGIKEEINSAIQDVLESQAFILGPQVKEFEGLFASYCNTNHAIGVSSGTDALLLALKSLGIGDGDEVITTPFTFFATVSLFVMSALNRFSRILTLKHTTLDRINRKKYKRKNKSHYSSSPVRTMCRYGPNSGNCKET